MIYGHEWCFASFGNSSCNLKTLQNISSDHKLQNARAVHAIFCLLYSQQYLFLKLLCMSIGHITRNAFQRFGKCSYVFFELIIYNNIIVTDKSNLISFSQYFRNLPVLFILKAQISRECSMEILYCTLYPIYTFIIDQSGTRYFVEYLIIAIIL